MIVQSRGAEQFPIRMPDGLRDRIKAAAKAKGRSMNTEIIMRLMASFDPEPSALDAAVATAIDAHVEARVTARLQEISAALAA